MGGQNCDTDFDECGNGLCPKGTVCQALEMNQFTCVCPERGCNNLDEEEYQNLLAQVSLPEEDDAAAADDQSEESSYDSYQDNAYEAVNSTNYESAEENNNSNSDYEYQTIDENNSVTDSDVEENNSYDIYGEESVAEENVYGEEVATAYDAYEQSVVGNSLTTNTSYYKKYLYFSSLFNSIFDNYD